MRTSRHPWRAGAEPAGAVMMYILLMTGLLTVITVGVMFLIAADLSAGVRQLQSVRVFSVTEAGVHYAIARLSTAGADTYAGETISITDGATVLGSAQITVNCPDGAALPCSGPNVAYRRIISTGTLPVAGPVRTMVVVLQGFPLSTSSYAVCAYDAVVVNQATNIYGDVGANGTITLSGPSSGYARVRADAPPPYTNNGYYTGSARATGAITCSQGCPVQVAGTTAPFAPGPVCPVATLPVFSPGPNDMTVSPPGWTMNGGTGYDWDEITLGAAGTAGGCSGANPYNDLMIETGAAGTTTVVNVRRLTMGRCGRLVVLGAGRVDLRISEPTGQALLAGQYSRFGVLPGDSPSTPAPVPAGRLVVSVQSSAQDPNPNAVQFDRASQIAGTFIVPNGKWDADRLVGATGSGYGAVLARRVDIDRDFIFTYDSTASTGSPTYSNFTRLRSWKDQ